MSVILYHHGAPYSPQRVRLAFAEKGAPFESRLVDIMAGEHKKPDYLAINPRGLVPALVDGDRVIVESFVICEYVEENFAGPALMPKAARDRADARWWGLEVSTHMHEAMSMAISATGVRELQKQRPAQEVRAELKGIPDPLLRQRKLSLFDHGVDAPEFGASVEAILHFLDELDRRLRDRTWVMGDAVTLADCGAYPYVRRLKEYGAGSLLDHSRRPDLARWFDAFSARPSVDVAITKWMPAGFMPMIQMVGSHLLPHLPLS